MQLNIILFGISTRPLLTKLELQQIVASSYLIISRSYEEYVSARSAIEQSQYQVKSMSLSKIITPLLIPIMLAGGFAGGLAAMYASPSYFHGPAGGTGSTGPTGPSGPSGPAGPPGANGTSYNTRSH